MPSTGLAAVITLIEGACEAARSFLDDLDVTGPGLYGSPAPTGG